MIGRLTKYNGLVKLALSLHIYGTGKLNSELV